MKSERSIARYVSLITELKDTLNEVAWNRVGCHVAIYRTHFIMPCNNAGDVLTECVSV